MFNLHFNPLQRRELSKALFNSGNLVFGALILGQVVAEKFEASMFLIGFICFVVFFYLAIILLKDERSAW
jgi:hypothetical protein